MVYFVIALGLLIAIAGAFLLVVPSRVAALLGGMTFTSAMRYGSAFGRFAIGTVLYFAAYQTKFSLAIQILAMLTVLGGIIVLIVNPKTVQYWMARAATFPSAALRTFSLVPLAIGAFLIHAAT